MKRLTCSLLVLCMLLSLAACGSKPGDSSSPPSNTPNGNVTSAPGGGDEPGSELFPERTEPITALQHPGEHREDFHGNRGQLQRSGQ